MKWNIYLELSYQLNMLVIWNMKTSWFVLVGYDGYILFLGVSVENECCCMWDTKKCYLTTIGQWQKLKFTFLNICFKKHGFMLIYPLIQPFQHIPYPYPTPPLSDVGSTSLISLYSCTTIHVFSGQIQIHQDHAVADPRGRTWRPPRVPIVPFWHTIVMKHSRFGTWRPPYKVGAPPYGKSWIRHCHVNSKWVLLWKEILSEFLINMLLPMKI